METLVLVVDLDRRVWLKRGRRILTQPFDKAVAPNLNCCEQFLRSFLTVGGWLSGETLSSFQKRKCTLLNYSWLEF